MTTRHEGGVPIGDVDPWDQWRVERGDVAGWRVRSTVTRLIWAFFERFEDAERYRVRLEEAKR